MLKEYEEIVQKLYDHVGYDGYGGDITVHPETPFTRHNDCVEFADKGNPNDQIGKYLFYLYNGRSQRDNVYEGENYIMFIEDVVKGTSHIFFDKSFEVKE